MMSKFGMNGHMQSISNIQDKSQTTQDILLHGQKSFKSLFQISKTIPHLHNNDEICDQSMANSGGHGHDQISKSMIKSPMSSISLLTIHIVEESLSMDEMLGKL